MKEKLVTFISFISIDRRVSLAYMKKGSGWKLWQIMSFNSSFLRFFDWVSNSCNSTQIHFICPSESFIHDTWKTVYGIQTTLAISDFFLSKNFIVCLKQFRAFKLRTLLPSVELTTISIKFNKKHKVWAAFKIDVSFCRCVRLFYLHVGMVQHVSDINDY